jgi:hypothetical protein
VAPVVERGSGGAGSRERGRRHWQQRDSVLGGEGGKRENILVPLGLEGGKYQNGLCGS